MTTHTNVAVIGATGRLGERLASQLLDCGLKPKLLVRGGAGNPKAKELSAYVSRGATLVDADLSDEPSLDPALEGVDLLISAVQGGPEIVIDGQVLLAERAKEMGVGRIIPSDFSVDWRPVQEGEHIFLNWRQEASRRIAEVGVPQTNVFNGAFMEMLTLFISDVLDWEARGRELLGRPGAGVRLHDL